MQFQSLKDKMMQNLLDKIVLSNNVVEEFYKYYQKPLFKNWLDGILPEIPRCKEVKQDNPWHIYDCLDHLLHSVEEMNKQTKNYDYDTRKMLAYTMLLHDIGKPDCVLRRFSKEFNREIESFFHHSTASVKIADRALPALGFNSATAEKIKALVAGHDIFMFITLEDDHNPWHHVLTPAYLQEEIDKLEKAGDGKTLMKQLIMVGRADSRSQNPKLTGPSLNLLDIMDNMLLNHNKPKDFEQKR